MAGDAGRRALALLILLTRWAATSIAARPRPSWAIRALAVARDAIAKGIRPAVRVPAARFLYLPFEHSESHSRPGPAIRCFTALVERLRSCLPADAEEQLDYAHRHRVIIQRSALSASQCGPGPETTETGRISWKGPNSSF